MEKWWSASRQGFHWYLVIKAFATKGIQQSQTTSGASSTQTRWQMRKPAVCLDGAPSFLLGRKKTRQCKSGSPNLFPDKILVRTEHDSLVQRPYLFSWTCLMVKSGHGQGMVGMHFKYNAEWTVGWTSGVSSSSFPLCRMWLLTSMVPTSALLALTVRRSILLKISFLDSLSSGAFAIDPVKQRRSRKSKRTPSTSVFKTL